MNKNFRIWNATKCLFEETSDLYIHFPDLAILHTSGSKEVLSMDNFFIIQQSIGVIDKNGIEIYEGDIVHFEIDICEHKTEEIMGEVFFKEGIFYFDKDLQFAMNDANLRKETLEVVGNIFQKDNNELP